MDFAQFSNFFSSLLSPGSPLFSHGGVGFWGGLLMGLASSLHCAGMCGAIGSSLIWQVVGRDAPLLRRLGTLGIGLVGKTLTYGLAGAVVGGLGGAVFGMMQRDLAYKGVQILAALSLIWVALTLMDLAPPLSGLDRWLFPLRQKLMQRRTGERPGSFMALVWGGIWGLLPCGMVFGALLYASLAGSALGALWVMLGFGLGTLPGVMVSALALTGAVGASLKLRPWFRRGIGLALVGLAVMTLFWPMTQTGGICAPV